MVLVLSTLIMGTKKPLFSKKEGFKLYRLSQIMYFLISYRLTKLLQPFQVLDTDTNRDYPFHWIQTSLQTFHMRL